MGEPLGLLKVMVVRGKRLVIRDFKSSDPYVIVKLGSQVILGSKIGLVPTMFMEHLFFTFCISGTYASWRSELWWIEYILLITLWYLTLLERTLSLILWAPLLLYYSIFSLNSLSSNGKYTFYAVAYCRVKKQCDFTVKIYGFLRKLQRKKLNHWNYWVMS